MGTSIISSGDVSEFNILELPFLILNFCNYLADTCPATFCLVHQDNNFFNILTPQSNAKGLHSLQPANPALWLMLLQSWHSLLIELACLTPVATILLLESFMTTSSLVTWSISIMVASTLNLKTFFRGVESHFCWLTFLAL